MNHAAESTGDRRSKEPEKCKGPCKGKRYPFAKGLCFDCLQITPGGRLTAARTQQGLSAQTLAVICGLPISDILGLEADETPPSLFPEDRRQICRHLGIDPAEIWPDLAKTTPAP